MNKRESVFDPAFEEKIIQTIIVDYEFARQMIEVIDPVYFNEAHCIEISKIYKDYYYQYDAFPSLELLPSIIEGNTKNSIVTKKCNDFLNKIKKNPLNGDIEYVKERSLEFFRLQHIYLTLEKEIFPRIEKGSGRLEEIVPLIEKAVNKGSDNNIGYEYHEDQEERFNEENIKTIPTLWKSINKLLKGGGFGEKRLVTFIAPPGAGKSTILVNVGKSALLQGKTVVHYTFELDWREVAQKYDSSITGIEIDNIAGNKFSILKSLKEKLPETARLIIKEYPVRGASIQTIKAHLSKLRLQNIHPDLIIIDQGGNLKSSNKNKEEVSNLSSNWLDMKNLAQTFMIPVITAHQINRTGYNDDLILPDQIAGCFDILGTTDILITMARNVEQKRAGIGKMYFAKNRQGKDGIILGYAINGDKALFEIYEMTEEFEKLIEEQKEERQEKENRSLSEKLEKFVEVKKKDLRVIENGRAFV